MANTKPNAQIKDRTARAKLAPKGEPYWMVMEKGRSYLEAGHHAEEELPALLVGHRGPGWRHARGPHPFGGDQRSRAVGILGRAAEAAEEVERAPGRWLPRKYLAEPASGFSPSKMGGSGRVVGAHVRRLWVSFVGLRPKAGCSWQTWR